MPNQLYIPIVLGTTRYNRQTTHAANLIKDVGEAIPEIRVELIDVRDFFPLPGEGNDEESKHQGWADINKRSDAYIIVAPEYNHGYPGSLKMLLDNDLGNYTHKPVTIAGVSAGPFGGARMIENLAHVVRELGLVITHTDIYFPQVQKIFDNNGELQDDAMIERIQSAYKELIWMAKSLKWGRDNL